MYLKKGRLHVRLLTATKLADRFGVSVRTIIPSKNWTTI